MTDIESIMKILIMMVRNVLFLQDAAEVNGWKKSVRIWILIRIQIAWISEFEWSCQQVFLLI